MRAEEAAREGYGALYLAMVLFQRGLVWTRLGKETVHCVRRCGLVQMVQMRVSAVSCSGRNSLGFSGRARFASRGCGVWARKRAGRGWHGVARTMPCTLVCGARQRRACMLWNRRAALDVHGGHGVRSERGSGGGLWAAWAAATHWVLEAVSKGSCRRGGNG
jgi:hypothetical protein